MKKVFLSVTLILTVAMLSACNAEDGESPSDNEDNGDEPTETLEGWEVAHAFDYEDIAEWDPMVTPNGEADKGSVESVSEDGEFVAIKAGESGFGGLQTPALEVDLTRNPMLMVQVHESEDQFQWGAQTIITDHVGDEWGLYVINDNDLKWNHYAGARVDEAIGAAYANYGDVVDLHFWLYPTGSEDAILEVSSVYIVYMD